MCICPAAASSSPLVRARGAAFLPQKKPLAGGGGGGGGGRRGEMRRGQQRRRSRISSRPAGRLAGLAWAASIGWVWRQKLMKRIEGRRKAPWRVTNDDPREIFFPVVVKACRVKTWCGVRAGLARTGLDTLLARRRTHAHHTLITLHVVLWIGAERMSQTQT
ncbi:uncharacterized protein IWZ02DRAFT_157825 [Phyllosticta citriasiana]|uniref:uncharacterized protein n=1 Tax=Phyllosticta citriasiana TaxID=595635 RepID=UPI0030FDED5A